ncbi:hypothetical protein EDB87DRAFT_1681539 [Lactarius vividus]|nr:hypothetical protein EDB87DRAFT_1681539 [Lactarius vividus]
MSNLKTNKMVKKKAAAATAAAPKPAPKADIFPEISEKNKVLCDTFLGGPGLVAEECRTFVDFIDSQPLELTPPKKRGEADRINYRVSISSPEFAGRLWTVLLPHLPSFPYPASVTPLATGARMAHSLNSNIRVYKYTPSQHFNPHYDDSVRDAKTGAVSEWTLLIYLTGVEDGVRGGETIFYPNSKAKPSEAMVVPLTRGTALLHRHGGECLLHEGSQVRSGTKYILRSDIMFMN